MTEPTATRRRLLTSGAALAATAAAGCGTTEVSECDAYLRERSTEDDLLASVSISMDGNEEGSITLRWWDPVGIEENPTDKVIVYGDDGEESTTIRPDTGARQSSKSTSFDSQSTILVIHVLNEEGAVIAERELEVDC